MIAKEIRQELAAKMRALAGLRKKRPTVVEVAGKKDWIVRDADVLKKIL